MYRKAQISRSKDLPMQLPATSVWFQSSILWHGNQINKCTTLTILSHGTKITNVPLSISMSTVPINKCDYWSKSILFLRVVYFFLKSMINNPEFCQFILQVQSGVIYFYNLIIFFRNPTVQNLSQFHSLVSSQKTDVEMDAPRFWGISNPKCS